jgi:phage shock protein A
MKGETMKIFERAGRLIRSDAHGILDQLEEHSLLMKQHLRDAELELNRKRASVEELEDEQRRLREQVERLNVRAQSLDEDVELALGSSREELARFALRKLLPIKEAGREARARISELGARRDRLAECLSEQEAEFEELKVRVEVRLAEARDERGAAPSDARQVADEEIEIELLRRTRVQHAMAGDAP